VPWNTPTLKQVRQIVRDDVGAAFGGAVILGNSVLRIMSDAVAGLGHLVLRYIDWLARQLLPDTAETEWLDRHGDIWLINSDGSTGRKGATYASGTVTVTGTYLTLIPQYTTMSGGIDVQYETMWPTTIGTGPTTMEVRALDAGTVGNLDAGAKIFFETALAGVNGETTVVVMVGGTNAENDDDLRGRVLERIRKPPMGGDKDDYEQWTKSLPGVTRAWCAPLEMGIGTVTVRFMMDDLRGAQDGFPDDIDVLQVDNYIDSVRPVAVKDFFVTAPVPYNLYLTIKNLEGDDASVRASIFASVKSMLLDKAIPGQTIYRSWVDEAIAQANGVDHYDLTFDDAIMPSTGHLASTAIIQYA
jgi:uncharacterized phage protein gp47/JayE